jgi:hypothetical protein
MYNIQRSRTSDRTVPIAAHIQPTRQCPPADNEFQKFVRSMRIASNHQWLHNGKTSTRRHTSRPQHPRHPQGYTYAAAADAQDRCHSSYRGERHARSHPTQRAHRHKTPGRQANYGRRNGRRQQSGTSSECDSSARTSHRRITTATFRTVWLINPSGMGRQLNDLLRTAE